MIGTLLATLFVLIAFGCVVFLYAVVLGVIDPADRPDDSDLL